MAYRLSSDKPWLCILIKCLAAAISSTVMTQGWFSRRVVAFTEATLPLSLSLIQFDRSLISLRFKLSSPKNRN